MSVMGFADTVRDRRANIRAALASNDMAFGHACGLRISRGFLHEIGAHVSEVHGRRKAAEMLWEAGDRIAHNVDFSDPDPAPTVIDLVEPGDAVETSPESESSERKGLARVRAALYRLPWQFLWGLAIGAILVAGNA